MSGGTTPTAHPLDPVTAAEIDVVREVLARERRVGAGWRYTGVEAVEPSKAALEQFRRTGTVPPRLAQAVVLDRAANAVFRARVDLGAGALTSFTHVPDVQPNVTLDEWEEANAVLVAHPDVRAALARRGITDLSLVFMDTWTYGASFVPPAHAGRRVGWSDTWVRASPGANPYAGPVNGLHCVIDLNAMELLEIEDVAVPERPAVMGEYVPRLVPEALQGGRPPRRPLEISQPEGVSFTVEGQLVRWQNWSFRVGFNVREGMTLHDVRYADAYAPGGPCDRSVAHKLSFAEMVVPYRDPGPDHVRRTAFDIGEWGLGFLTQSLELGCDCLGEIRYLDATVHDSTGTPRVIRDAICLHEEDNGVLWKHVDADSGAEVRRMRRFVVSFHVTVANYEYLVYWRFHEDGSIECEVRATGIMVVTHLAEDAAAPYGVLVDQRTYAPHHQHFIVARLDLDVDGPDNTVQMTETRAVPMGPDNPHGIAVAQHTEALRTEQEGRQDYRWESQRAWKVVNPHVLNGLGTPVAYKLVPGAALPTFFDPASPVFGRAQVIGHTLWVTPEHPDERWPAGEFVTQSRVGEGLPRWTAADRSIEDTDVVLWYTFGIHHVARPEDWPVMPVDVVSFWLKPVGFFDRNPALDVEPSGDHCAPSGGHTA
ncbi:primary-amine oxidase [Microlunatus capsulatus]|uniref:Amine oxidase n=1 Tax=Microlunatus capsulatus TaxID=99117 RepID=A0ABS4Z985_9ACTN|nr:primary-amine oxidase [Microlunatus capsulatus]MBP2417305.1 primary-amine oxidase [Microlunatus capsulatus]